MLLQQTRAPPAMGIPEPVTPPAAGGVGARGRSRLSPLGLWRPQRTGACRWLLSRG